MLILLLLSFHKADVTYAVGLKVMASEGPGGCRVVVLVPPVGAVPVVVRAKEEAAYLLRIRAVSRIAPVGERALVDVILSIVV